MKNERCKAHRFIFILRTFRKEDFSASNLNDTAVRRSDFLCELCTLIKPYCMFLVELVLVTTTSVNLCFKTKYSSCKTMLDLNKVIRRVSSLYENSWFYSLSRAKSFIAKS